MDTAALMKNLDLIISVDTAPCHLAGAMNLPTWILLPYPPDWRWLRNRTDSVWYPSVRLFTQSTQGDWTSVITSVVNTLQKKLSPNPKNKSLNFEQNNEQLVMQLD